MADHKEIVKWFVEQFPSIPKPYLKRGDSFVDRLAMAMLALGGCDNARIDAMKAGIVSLAHAEPLTASGVRRVDQWLNPSERHGEDFSKLLATLLGGTFSTSGAAAIGRGEFLFWLTCPTASPQQADFRDREGQAFNLKTLPACIAPGRNIERGTVAIDRINAETWGKDLVPGQKRTFARWSALAAADPVRLKTYLAQILPNWPRTDIESLAAATTDYDRFNLVHGLLCMRNGASTANLRGYIMLDPAAAEVICLLSEDFTEAKAKELRLSFRSHLSRKRDTNSTPEGYTVVKRAGRARRPRTGVTDEE
ncbi:MAG: hypothetical protein FJ286_16075 [Planctomycetes bacterium]|nr:hypothetical protein [Planctomycetota bacterium]